MNEAPSPDFSIARRVSVLGGEDGYDIWFDHEPREGDATTPELQSLCRGWMVVGHIGARMQWEWKDTLRHVQHLSAPLADYLLIEVSEEAFYSERFRRALHDGVLAAGLDPYKVRVSDLRNGDVYILGHGLLVV